MLPLTANTVPASGNPGSTARASAATCSKGRRSIQISGRSTARIRSYAWVTRPRMRSVMGVLQKDERAAGLDLVAGADEDLVHDPGRGGVDGGLHLHRLQQEEPLAGRNPVA